MRNEPNLTISALDPGKDENGSMSGSWLDVIRSKVSSPTFPSEKLVRSLFLISRHQRFKLPDLFSAKVWIGLIGVINIGTGSAFNLRGRRFWLRLVGCGIRQLQKLNQPILLITPLSACSKWIKSVVFAELRQKCLI